MSKYQVIVGNVGTVYDGSNPVEARKSFGIYKAQSKDGYGRAANETVTFMEDGELKFEFHPKLKTPTIAELAAIIVGIKPHIQDDYKEEEDEEPSIQLTIGCGFNGWSWQSGDNSYTGGAYGFPFWGVGYVTRRCNSRQLAREIINDALEQQY